MSPITEVKATIRAGIAAGNIGELILDSLRGSDGCFLDKETELWDYKSSLGEAKVDQAELVRDVLAFYNTFGGYLILGVADNGSPVGGDAINQTH